MHITYKIISGRQNESHVYEVYHGKFTHKFTGTDQEAKDWVADIQSTKEDYKTYFDKFTNKK